MARPTFKPTAAQRNQVAIAAGAGMAHDDIALSLGICRNTLTKHFEKELGRGAAAKRLAVLTAMHTMAVKGNVAAQKAYIALSNPSAAGAAGKPKGKKEQAKDAAVGAEAGTGWEGLIGGNVTPIRGAG